MRTIRIVSAGLGLLFLFPALALPEQRSLRDPFWPLEYVPETREREEPSVESEREAEFRRSAPPPKVPLREQPPGEKDWVEAERVLGIAPARYSMGFGADGSAFVLLWGRIAQKGDLVSAVHDGVEFSWRLEEIGPGRTVLERSGATRRPRSP